MRNVVIEPKLNPGDKNQASSSIQTIEKTISGLEQDVTSVATFFSAPGGIADRVPAAAEDHFKSTGDIEAAIKSQFDRVLDPPRVGGGGLSAKRWVIVIIALISVSALSWYLVSPFLDGVLTVLVPVALGAAFALILALLLRRPKPLEEIRHSEEDRLIELYEALIYRQAADYLFAGVGEIYTPAIRQTLTGIRGQLVSLRTVYGELQGRARTRRTRAGKQPLHSVDQVGVKITLQPHQSGPYVASLTQLVRLVPEFGQNRLDFTLTTRALSPVSGNSARVSRLFEFVSEQNRGGMGEVPGQREFESIDKALDDLGAAILQNFLPFDFQGAMVSDGSVTQAAQIGRMQELLRRLMHRDDKGRPLPELDRRRSSLALNQANPAFRLILVPDAAIAGLVNMALDGITDAGTRGELTAYVPIGGLEPVPQLGPSIATLTVWQTGDLALLPEVLDAKATYYGASADHGQAGFMSQRDWNFQILPEAAAAAAIELGDALIEPLSPVVVARLLGSDPGSVGPSLIELFYLLRCQKALEITTAGQGANQTRLAQLHVGNRPLTTLYSQPPIVVPPTSDPFGRGRFIANAFDSFCDFMFCDGAQQLAGVTQEGKYTELPFGAIVHTGEWARLGPVELGRIQREIVEMWFENRTMAQLTEDETMISSLVDEDAQRMTDQNGNPTSVSADWARAVKYLARQGMQKRAQVARPD